MSVDFKIQGCLTGLIAGDEIQLGCERNSVDAVLCVCSSDLCNSESALLPLINANRSVSTDLATCVSYTDATFSHHRFRNKATTCQSDYCFFTETNTTEQERNQSSNASRSETIKSASCGAMPQYNFPFLIGSLWPGGGLFAHACYRLRTRGNEELTGCACSTDRCNTAQPYAILNATRVECLMGVGYEDEMGRIIEDGGHCQGQYCLLQKQFIPDYGYLQTRGCLSGSRNSRLRDGYRSVLGTEHWLCSRDYCNYNTKTAMSNHVEVKFAWLNTTGTRMDYVVASLKTAVDVGGRVKAQSLVDGLNWTGANSAARGAVAIRLTTLFAVLWLCGQWNRA